MQPQPAYRGRPTEPGAKETDPTLFGALQNGPFSTALQLAIQARGLTLDRIQHRLAERGVHLSIATLSYWQRGRSQPQRASSLEAVRILEEVLGVASGSLAALVTPRRPRGRSHPLLRGSDAEGLLTTNPDALAHMLAQVDNSCDQRLARLSVHDCYHIDARRRPERMRIRQVVRAEDDDVGRCLVLYQVCSPDEPLPVLGTMRYCRPGRVRGDPDSGFFAAELCLDRVLARGDTAVLEFELEFSGARPMIHDYERGFRFPVREYVSLVQFHPDAVPARCYRYEKETARDQRRRRQELWLGTASSVHFVAHNVSSGILGIEWEWD